MATHKTTVGVDTARLLIIDPGYLKQINWPDLLGSVPKVDPKTGFVKVGPAGLGLIVSPTGYGDGAYNAEVLTFKDADGETRVARVTVTFDPAYVGDNPIDLEVEARLAAQGFKGRLPDELRTAEARRLADLDDRLRRLEAWAADGKTGPPIYPTGTAAQEDDQTRKAVVDHEARLRRLEVWVAGTTTTKQDGAAEYPLAAMVKPWADPEEVARLLASDDEDGLARLIYADPFAGLPDAEAAGDRPAAQGYNLVIGLNNTATNDPCAICGNRTDPEVGPELFLQGTEALVCYDCGRKHAPALVALLENGRESPATAARRLVDAYQTGEVVREIYPLRLGGKGFFVADTSSYPKDLGYLLRSVEEKPEAVLHSLEKEGLLFTPPHPKGLYWVDAVWANTPDPDDPPRWKTTLVAVTIRLDHFQALQEPTTDDNPDPFF